MSLEVKLTNGFVDLNQLFSIRFKGLLSPNVLFAHPPPLKYCKVFQMYFSSLQKCIDMANSKTAFLVCTRKHENVNVFCSCFFFLSQQEEKLLENCPNELHVVVIKKLGNLWRSWSSHCYILMSYCLMTSCWRNSPKAQMAIMKKISRIYSLVSKSCELKKNKFVF